MRTQRLIGIGALALIFSGAAANGFAQDVTLQYRWTKGEESRARLTQQTTTSIGAPGQTAAEGAGSFGATMTQVFRTIVDDVAADGSATLRQVIESVRAEMRMPSGTIVFDSEADGPGADANPMAKAMSAAYAAMIGQPVQMVVSPNGAVQKMLGFDRLLENILNAQPSDRVAPDVLDGFRNAFKDDVSRDMLGWGVALFPAGPLHAGDTWQDRLSATVPIFGPTRTLREWTLRDIDRTNGTPVAHLAAKITMEADPSAPKVAPGAVAFHFGATSAETEILFDVSRGRVQRATTVLTMPVTMAPPAANGTQTNVEMRIVGTVSLEVLEPGR